MPSGFTELLKAARAVAERWRGLLGKVYLQSPEREELEALIRTVDDYGAEGTVLGAEQGLPRGWKQLPNGDVRHHPSGFHMSVALLERLLRSAPAGSLDPARLPRPSGDLPWRVGRKIPIHLYDAKGHPLGTMLTVYDAARVVRAMNAPSVDALIDAAGVREDVDAGRDPVEAVTDLRRSCNRAQDEVSDLVGKLAIERSGGPALPTFAEVWAGKEAEGFQYGEDALEQVRFGWDLAMQQLKG